jgi:hypothetical protein
MAWLAIGCLILSASIGSAQEDGKIYRIKNRLSGKGLTHDESGNLLIQKQIRPRDKAMQWKLIKVGEFFQIENAESGKVLTSPSKEALEQISLEDNTRNDRPKVGQLWSFHKQQVRYTIQSRQSDLYLDVYDFGTEDGVKIIQQVLNGKGSRGNQVWELVPVD